MNILAAKRYQRLHAAEHRAALQLEVLSRYSVRTGERARADFDYIIDVCARAREARADVDDLGRGL